MCHTGALAGQFEHSIKSVPPGCEELPAGKDNAGTPAEPLHPWPNRWRSAIWATTSNLSAAWSVLPVAGKPLSTCKPLPGLDWSRTARSLQTLSSVVDRHKTQHLGMNSKTGPTLFGILATGLLPLAALRAGADEMECINPIASPWTTGQPTTG